MEAGAGRRSAGWRGVWFPLLALGPAALFLAAFLLLPLRFAPAGLAAFYSDDFFYYVVIARNIVAHGLSSFDGTTLTNGYHPLWMMVLCTLIFLTGGTGARFFAAVLGVQLAASLLALWLVFRILVRWRTQALAVIASTLIFAVALGDIAATGMEIVIAVPLILAFVAEADTAASRTIRPLRLGLLAAACILARVDTIILVCMIALVLAPAILARPRRGRTLAWLALGLAPAGAYLLANVVFMGTPLPISSAAKALTPGLFFNSVALRMAFTPGDFDPIEIMVIMLPAWCVLFCAIAGLLCWRRHDARARIRTMLFVFPPLFYGLLSLRSDWMLWRWYLYPIVAATPFALAWAGDNLIRAGGQAGRVAMTVTAVLFGLLPAALDVADHYANTTPAGNVIYTTALATVPFTASHPGRYAMGDRAGVMAFLTGQPVFQLEGVVGDRALLGAIKSRGDLLPVLKSRRVDYYIGTRMAFDGHCWSSVEPKPGQAGPLSPAMTIRLYSDPVFSFKDREGTVTQIFAVGRGGDGK